MEDFTREVVGSLLAIIVVVWVIRKICGGGSRRKTGIRGNFCIIRYEFEEQYPPGYFRGFRRS